MSIAVTLTIIFNLIWTLYLTFVVYKRNSKKTSEISGSDNLQTDNVQTVIQKSIQKVAIIRFNPYDDLGGDQSFCLALLDNYDSGVIITSLHNRDNTRVYAKPIKNGEGDGISLSREEKMVIVKAVKG